jgi:tetratricopeptide (TPR) repeat protein
MAKKYGRPAGAHSGSGRPPSSSAAVDWNEFDAALYEFTLTHLRRLARAFRSQTAHEVHIHCNAYYGEVFPYLDVRPQADGANAIRFPGYPTHPPRKPDGLDYSIDGWRFLELEPNPRQAVVRRWHSWSVAFIKWTAERELDSEDHDGQEEVRRLTSQFLYRVCLVALRLEKDTEFNFVQKEPCCVLFVEDHDEMEFESWKRLIEARIEFAPPWKRGNEWPIFGRQPEIAAAIFAHAAEYHARKQLPQAASLLREAIARLPELQGALAHQVKGTNVKLPIPEGNAWARAYLALTGQGFWLNEERSTKAINRALGFDSKLPEAYFLRAKLRAGGPVPAEMLDSAAKDLNRAISLDGSNPEFFALRAELRARPYYPFWQKALADYTRAHELDPFNQRWLMRRAEVQEQLGDYEAAITDYSLVFELRHSVVTWYVRDAIRGRARCLYQIGRIQQAVQDWNRLIKYEKYAEYFHNRAACFRKLGNKKRAAKDEQIGHKLEKRDDEE